MTVEGVGGVWKKKVTSEKEYSSLKSYFKSCPIKYEFDPGFAEAPAKALHPEHGQDCELRPVEK